MGSEEKKLRDRYGELAAELGDVVTKIRLAAKRQGEIEREIDALNAALPLVATPPKVPAGWVEPEVVEGKPG